METPGTIAALPSWNLCPSVGTWLMLSTFQPALSPQISPVDEIEAAELEARQFQFESCLAMLDEEEQEQRFASEVSELTLRQATFDLFWIQLDEQEQDAKFKFMLAELEVRQHAFDLFWSALDEQEQDDKFASMAPELAIRQAAFDFYWVQIDAAEEDERFESMKAELFARQDAFEFFWSQLDQQEQDDRFSFLAAELAARQAVFDLYWMEADQAAEDEKSSFMEAELSARQAMFDLFWSQSEIPIKPAKASAALPLFVGSPARSLLRAKALDAPTKASRPMARSASLSSIAMDLGLGFAGLSSIPKLQLDTVNKDSKVNMPKGLSTRSPSLGALRPLKSTVAKFSSSNLAPSTHGLKASIGRGWNFSSLPISF